MPEKRKTKVRKEITRNVQTKAFESLKITVNVEEEIEWETLEEKEKKHDKVTDMVIKDFNQTYEKVMKELELRNKPAVVETSNPPKEEPTSSPAFDGPDTNETSKDAPVIEPKKDDIFDEL